MSHIIKMMCLQNERRRAAAHCSRSFWPITQECSGHGYGDENTRGLWWPFWDVTLFLIAPLVSCVGRREPKPSRARPVPAEAFSCTGYCFSSLHPNKMAQMSHAMCFLEICKALFGKQHFCGTSQISQSTFHLPIFQVTGEMQEEEKNALY